jgi:hypothetical protein
MEAAMRSVRRPLRDPKRAPQRGYAMVLVMLVLALLALGFGLIIFVLSSSLAEARRVGGQLRAFYACDSAIRIASAVAQNVVLANPRKTPDEVTILAMDAVCATAGGCIGARTGCPACQYAAATGGQAAGPDGLMPDYANMERFELRVFPMVNTRAIQFGAFRDLFATQSLVSISTQGIDLATGSVEKARDTFSVASISPFQLQAFSTAPIAWAPFRPRLAPAATATLARLGPSIYSGAALSLGGGPQLQLLRAVSAGPMSPAGAVTIWDGNAGFPGFTSFTGPDGIRAFRINAPLKLTVQPSRTPGQPGSEAATSAHWLMQPPDFSAGGDNEATRQAKLAIQADIRIIDGVWFVKPLPGSGTPDWPGIPVWSDHAGSNVVPATAEEATLMGASTRIGQGDLAALHGWPSRPRRYSYYEAADDGRLLETPASGLKEGVGAVSYGTLASRSGRLIPGVMGALVTRGATTACPSIAFSALRPFDSCRSDSLNAPMGLLDGARNGLRDVSAQNAGRPANILPLNFDVEQLLQALADGSPGELGSYFCGAVNNPANPADVPANCRLFNGIVYITATWPGSLQGITAGGSPARAPAQGREATPIGFASLQPQNIAAPNQFYWLPRQLCGAPALEQLAPPRGMESGVVSLGAQFPLVGCNPAPGSAYQRIYVDPAGPRASVNAVRVINGRDLSAIIDHPVPQRFGNTRGLTVATNLPMYIYGDWNVTAGAPAVTGVSCPATGALPPECTFPLTLIAGDRTTFLSRVGPCQAFNPGFNDSCAQWTENLVSQPNFASQTFYFGAFMSGLSPGVGQENIESLFRVVERWQTTPGGSPSFNVTGAMFAAGRAIYHTEPQSVTGGYVPNPNFEWRYLSLFSGFDQPPGTPRFVVGVTSRWRDLR